MRGSRASAALTAAAAIGAFKPSSRILVPVSPKCLRLVAPSRCRGEGDKTRVTNIVIGLPLGADQSTPARGRPRQQAGRPAHRQRRCRCCRTQLNRGMPPAAPAAAMAAAPSSPKQNVGGTTVTVPIGFGCSSALLLSTLVRAGPLSLPDLLVHIESIPPVRAQWPQLQAADRHAALEIAPAALSTFSLSFAPPPRSSLCTSGRGRRDGAAGARPRRRRWRRRLY